MFQRSKSSAKNMHVVKPRPSFDHNENMHVVKLTVSMKISSLEFKHSGSIVFYSLILRCSFIAQDQKRNIAKGIRLQGKPLKMLLPSPEPHHNFDFLQ